jgi:hypothetical protein
MKTSIQCENILNEVFTKGCLLDLTIRTWQGRTTAKSFLNDLGIENKPWADRVVTGGQLNLIDDDIRKSFHQYEVKARIWLDQNSYPFLNARFVPFAALDLLLNGDDSRPGLTRMRQEFNMAVDDFIEKFDSIRSSYIDKMAQADEKYRKLLSELYPYQYEISNKFAFDWICYKADQPTIYDNKELDIKMNNILSDEALYFIDQAPYILNNKIAIALEKLFKSVNSKKTVKSSSLNAIRKAIENYEILNISDNDEILKFQQSLIEFKNSISDTQNIDKSNDEKRSSVKTDLALLILKAKSF